MQRLFRMIHKVARLQTSVMITGETGTGKEVVAQAIHGLSSRAGKPFVPVECTSLASSVIESELFGHRRGAFTGADEDRIGLIKAADGGTLFLDEIGDLRLDLQSKLLRAIQERQVRPLGATRATPVDIRIIAATNCDLGSAMLAGLFRSDLYFRLNVIPISVPPLRERKRDIPLLVKVYLDQFAPAWAPGSRVEPAAMNALMLYHWPGNVRQLRNAIESAVAMAEGTCICLHDLPPELAHDQRLRSSAVWADSGGNPDRVGTPQGEEYSGNHSCFDVHDGAKPVRRR